MTPLRLLAALLGVAVLAACSTGGGAPLSQGLSQRMDSPGASLNRAEAIGIVNSYRGTVGAAPLRSDASRSSSGASVVRCVIASATARWPACSAISRCISSTTRRYDG